MKKFLILLLNLLVLLVSSCKKEIVPPVADFDYQLNNHTIWDNGMWQIDHVIIKTFNYSYDDQYLPLIYLWQLKIPNGTILSSTEREPTFVCDMSGNCELKLTVSNSNCENTCIKTFYITVDYNGQHSDPDNPDDPDDPDDPITPPTPPTASFNINSSNGSFAPSVIRCINTSVNATHYQWTIIRPDNTSSNSTSKNPSFSCTQSGIYTLHLTAYNSDNQSSVYTMNIPLTTPLLFTITYLRLEDIPMRDGNNSTWDPGIIDGASPDIYFKILNSDNMVRYTSTTKNNVLESNLPVTWNNVNKTLDYSGNYIIRFIDYDDDLDGDETMVSCNLNTLNITPGVDTYTWSNTTIGVRFVLGISWSGE